MLSVNGRIKFQRTRYFAAGEGSDHPVDRLLDHKMGAAVSVGVRELCCRLGIAGRSFARSAANLKEASQISISEERALESLHQSNLWDKYGPTPCAT